MPKHQLPLSQVAISTIDLERSEIWWREGLGFLPSATTRMFRGKGLSGVVKMANAAATTRWVVGQDEWLQIELWQYENPVPRLREPDYAPNHVGFSRCGVWVKEFDATLKRLEALGSQPLSECLGEVGDRRVCVRDPDGIFVELFEKDPLEGRVSPAKFTCNAAFRSMTITTDNLSESTEFAEKGLGLQQAEQPIHTDEHETLWGFNEVDCDRQTYVSNAMLLEYVQYRVPANIARHPHSLLNDQGILNVAFGDDQSVKGIQTMCTQASKAGAIPSDWMHSPVAGCVYMTDPQGFSFEFMWAKPGFGQKFTGYFPNNKPTYKPADNRRVENSIWIDAPADTVFDFLADHEGMTDWGSFGTVELLNKGFNGEGGLGTQRLVHSRPFRITEQVTHWEPGKEMRYRILSGGPFNNYTGEVKIQSEDGATRVLWVNRFRAKLPGTGLLLQWLVKSQFKKLLMTLKSELSSTTNNANLGE